MPAFGTADKPVLLGSVALVTAPRRRRDRPASPAGSRTARHGAAHRPRRPGWWRRPLRPGASSSTSCRAGGRSGRRRPPSSASSRLAAPPSRRGQPRPPRASERRPSRRWTASAQEAGVRRHRSAAQLPARRRRRHGAAAAVAGALGQKLAAAPTAAVLGRPAHAADRAAGAARRARGQGQGHQRVPRPRTPTSTGSTPRWSSRASTSTAGGWRSTARSTSSSRITFAELLKMPMIEKDITLNCVSNEVGGPYISLHPLARRPRPGPARAGRRQDGVDQILSESTDGMTISTPVAGADRRPRRPDRRRHERRSRCPPGTASPRGWSPPASTASSAPPSG